MRIDVKETAVYLFDELTDTAKEHAREWWRELVFRTLEMAGVTMPDRETYFHELYDLFARPEVWRLFPDAVETLTAVRRRGLKAGLLSNWDHRLRPVLVIHDCIRG